MENKTPGSIPGNPAKAFQGTDMGEILNTTMSTDHQLTGANSSEKETESHASSLQINMKECIDVCLETQRVCTQTVPHCLAQGGLYSDLKLIHLLLECAEFCALNANFMMRGSERHYSTCRLCAEICEQCAIACAHFADDIFMTRCAEACRKSLDACNHMADSETKKEI